MIDLRIVLLLATLLGAAGLWLMLPRGYARGRMAGTVLAAASLGMFASQLPGVGSWFAGAVFYVLAGVTLVSAAATVTFRNPVYCAIWFGLMLLSTAGLFLLQGAQFLAVATVIVYAGAILVTFLFVLMLAEPTGRAHYDRVSWEAVVSVSCGAALIGVLTTTLLGALAAGPVSSPFAESIGHAPPLNPLVEDQMAGLGDALFGRYLIATEAAGLLLLAALVGAAVIVGRSRGPLMGPVSGPATGPRQPVAPGPEEGNGHA